MNISLPDEMRSFVEKQVASGLYANASDFFRAVLRDQLWRRDDLVSALEQGEASGLSSRTPEEVFDSVLGKRA